MTHSLARGDEISREARRRQVAGLLLGGVTDQWTIARQLGVNQSTISRDIKAIEADWRERVAAEVATAKGRDDARLDRLYAAATTNAHKGDVGSINACVKILARRAAMWGYDAPSKSENTVNVNVRQAAEKVAADLGVSVDVVLAETYRMAEDGA